ncbi:MAG: YfhO family protein, partial [Clostridia bacterium]|nr:YfhO family protein [Clostridia bacterium]
VYAFHGIFPFGNRSLLIIDLYHQYAPFLSDLQEKLKSFSGLLYSSAGGLGTSYLPLYAYYLASPLNPIIVLFPKAYLAEAVLVLTLLKVGLAGACFSIYLKGVHREQSMATVAFSLLYALSGYVLVFSWNIMWMDAIYLLPLIILGLVKLVRDSRGVLLCITLAAALLSNFYMAFFICLFILVYYPVCLLQYHSFGNPMLLFKKTAQAAGFSLLSAGLSSVLLIPTYFALKLTSAAEDVFPKTLTNYFHLFDYITRHFTYPSPSIREGMPNLYCGIVILILLPVYFLSKEIRLKEKMLHLALILVLILSFNLNVLNFIWHGFHYPNQIPYRFSFVYVFLVLSMGYTAFKRLEEVSGKHIGLICFAVASLVVLSQKFDKLAIDYLTVYVSLVFVILYAAALAYDRCNTVILWDRALLFALVAIMEMFSNTALTIQKIDSLEGFSGRDGYAVGKKVVQVRQRIADIKATDKGFYRMEVLPPQTANDPFLYNYPGLSIFSSTAPVKPVEMLQNLGYHSNGINSYEYEGSTEVLDSIFGIKYLIHRSLNMENKLYTQIAGSEELAVFSNPYALPVGFLAPKQFASFNSNGSNPFSNQNRLVEGISGIKEVISPVDGQKQGTLDNLTFSSSGTHFYSFKRTNKDMSSIARVKLEFIEEGHSYLYYKAPYDMKGNGFVMVDGRKIEFNPRHSTIINLGKCKSGANVELQLNFEKTSPESGSFSLYAGTLNLAMFEKAVSVIKNKAITVESFSNNHISGYVEAKEDGLLVMSIPYDKGWQVTVGGRKVKTQALDDCLLSFEVPQGSHKLELKYFPEKFFTGLAISLASVVILVLVMLKGYGIRRKNIKQKNQEVSGNG